MQFRLIHLSRLVVLLVLVMVVFSGCLNMGPTPTPTPSPTPEEPIESPDAVNFTLPNIDGGTVSLSDFRGRPVWLVFFRPGCPACTDQAPIVARLYDRYRDTEELVVLGIGIETNSAQLRQIRTRYGWTFPVLNDFDRTVYRQFFTGGVPANVFINRRGEVQDEVLGNRDEAVFGWYLNQIF
ncbi:MAG TPA: TlpA disulfide reductase family protein [Atribacteraceae bacterium]|nr:TlpA disulfide reductase family protein [Atribacteraceae bacterium]